MKKNFIDLLNIKTKITIEVVHEPAAAPVSGPEFLLYLLVGEK